MSKLSFGQPMGGIIQVAHVVEDLAAAARHWSKTLGIGPFFVFDHFPLFDAQYRGGPIDFDVSLGLAFSGSICFELIQQNNDAPSVYREVVQKRGYGFHHWAIATDDFEGSVRHYEQQGFEMALYGVAGVGARAAYMDTYDQLGGMIELIEVTPKVDEFFGLLHDAAKGWDGQNPIRTL